MSSVIWSNLFLQKATNQNNITVIGGTSISSPLLLITKAFVPAMANSKCYFAYSESQNVLLITKAFVPAMANSKCYFAYSESQNGLYQHILSSFISRNF